MATDKGLEDVPEGKSQQQETARSVAIVARTLLGCAVHRLLAALHRLPASLAYSRENRD